MRRDFTYIDDLVEAVIRLIDVVPEQGKPVAAEGVEDSLSPVAPWRAVNIGGGQPVGLMPFIETIERHLGKPANKIDAADAEGRRRRDLRRCFAADRAHRLHAEVRIDEGVKALVDWYRSEMPGDRLSS